MRREPFDRIAHDASSLLVDEGALGCRLVGLQRHRRVLDDDLAALTAQAPECLPAGDDAEPATDGLRVSEVGDVGECRFPRRLDDVVDVGVPQPVAVDDAVQNRAEPADEHLPGAPVARRRRADDRIEASVGLRGMPGCRLGPKLELPLAGELAVNEGMDVHCSISFALSRPTDVA